MEKEEEGSAKRSEANRIVESHGGEEGRVAGKKSASNGRQ